MFNLITFQLAEAVHLEKDGDKYDLINQEIHAALNAMGYEAGHDCIVESVSTLSGKCKTVHVYFGE
jgi:hypothetical protein